jgi:hypothetical protein
MGAAVAVLFGLVSAAPFSRADEITIKRERRERRPVA